MRLALLFVCSTGLWAQASGDEFSIMIFTDVHAPDHTAQAATMADWVTAHAAEWNVKALVGVGDYRGTALTTQCETVHWDSFVANFRSRLPALPSVWAVGNHDQCYSNWDTYFGNFYAWTSAYPSAADPRNQYIALDVTSEGRIYKLGLMSFDFGVAMASGTQPRTWAQGILNASVGRQFLVFPHVLLNGGTIGAITGHYCNSAADCSAAADIGVQFQNNFLVPNPRIIATVNGHVSYYPAYATTTTTAGTTIYSFGSDGAGSGTALLWILKFRPTAKKFEIAQYNATGGLQNSSVQSYDWVPSGALFPLPSPVSR